MYKQKLVLISVLFFCFALRIYSQIQVNPNVGCMPVGLSNANFSYTGPGTPSGVTWNFGDGTTSGLNPTQHTYPNPGTYIVTFNATVNGSPVTYTAQVKVHPAPTGNFSCVVDANGCAPRNVTFNATSPDPNANFTWDFGDFSGGSGATTTHAYGPGTFNPFLLITGSGGCITTVTLTNASINVSAPPNIVFTSNPGLFACANTYAITFDASGSTTGSPTGGGLTFAWDFGNGQTSTSASPGTITYNGQGIYPVTCTASDNNNCSYTYSTSVSLIQPSVVATVPASVCIDYQAPPGSLPFQVSVQSSQPSTTWDMGDGTIITFPIPSINPPTPLLTPNSVYTSTIHTYTTPGLKTVSITAGSGPCVATDVKTIFVEEIYPQFAATPIAYTCSPTMTVSYLNQTTVNSGNQLSYTWYVDHWRKNPALGYWIDSYSSTAVNPTITISQISQYPYTLYSPAYAPKAILTVTSIPLSCISDITHVFDSIRRPTANFVKSKMEGCAPLAVTFSSTTQTNETIFPVTSYTWFSTAPSGTVSGPGPNIPNFNYVFTTPGTYSVWLAIETASNCAHTSFTDVITVVSPPLISFTIPPGPFCVGDPVSLNLSAGSGGPVQHWHVISDNGHFSDCINQDNPTWKFTNPGVHSFTIQAWKNSCKSETVAPQLVTVSGPAVELTYRTNCTNKRSVDFFYKMFDGGTAGLSYGVGEGSSPPILGAPGATVQGSFTHTYSATGDYTAVITANNATNTCYASHSIAVNIREPVANFTVDPVICKEGWLEMSAISNTNNLTGCSWNYAFYVGNYPPEHSFSPLWVSTLSFTTVGAYNAKLLVKDMNNCVDTMIKAFRVSEPAPTFSVNKNPICVSNYPIQFFNTTSNNPDPITFFDWNFGDGPTYASSSTSTLSNPFFSYNLTSQSQTFSVELIVRNAETCSASIVQTVQVNNPEFTVNLVDKPCIPPSPQAPTPLTFTLLANNTHTNYTINFDDGTVINNNTWNTNNYYSFVHTYTSGAYTPTITVTDNVGCTKSIILPVINVEEYPQPTLTLIPPSPVPGNHYCNIGPSDILCTTQFPRNKVWHYWDTKGGGVQPGDSMATNIFTPSPYAYTPTVNVLSPLTGCPGTAKISFWVHEPGIEMMLVPETKTIYCLGEPVTFSVTNRNILTTPYFMWDFKDGIVKDTLNSIFQHVGVYADTIFHEPDGVLTVRVTGFAGGAPHCKDFDERTIRVIKVSTDFKRNLEQSLADYSHCLNLTDVFTSTASASSGPNLSYSWNFGDGGRSQAANPSYKYNAPGNYSVNLIVTEPVNSCTATAMKTMTVFPLPKASLLILDTLACAGDTFKIICGGQPGISGILEGTLTPGTNPFNFGPSNSFTLLANAAQSTTYALTVKDENGCVSSPVQDSIRIQQPPEVTNTFTRVVIGAPVQVSAPIGHYSYSWTPVTDNLNCSTCPNPISSTTVDVTYSVTIMDEPLQCFITTSTFSIFVLPLTSVDVPSAFTPNGDGVNDIVYPDGWGIRKLIYFRIFNRWGQLVFESNDLSVGWDGTMNGVPQNMETYVWQVSVETWVDSNPVISKTGTVKLIR